MNSLDTVSDEQKPAPAKNPARFELPLLSRDKALSLVRCATPAEASAVLSNVPAAAVAGITCCNVAIVWDMESCYAEPDAPLSAYAYKLCGQEPWLPFEHLDIAALLIELEALLERAAAAEAAECESLTFLLPLTGGKEPSDDMPVDDLDGSCAGGREAKTLDAKPANGLKEGADAVDHEEPELKGVRDVIDEAGFAEDARTITDAADEIAESPARNKAASVAVDDEFAAVSHPKRATSESSDSVPTGNPLESEGNAGGTALEPLDGVGKGRAMGPGTHSPAQPPRRLFGDQEGRQSQARQEVEKGTASTPKKAEPKRRGAIATFVAKAAEPAATGKPAEAPAHAGAQRGDRDTDINEAVENAKRSAEIAASGHVRQVEHGAISR